MHETIANILLRAKAVSLSPKKPFIFASGIKSPIYCDNRILLSYPVEREVIVHSFLQLIKKNNLKFDIIAGTATAGIPWASWIAAKLRKPMVYVRGEQKKHGKKNQIEGILDENSNVLVIEDLISSGKSSIAVVQAIKSKNSKISAVVSLFNYNMAISKRAFKNHNIKQYSLCSLDQLLPVALEHKYINKQEFKMIIDWRNKT